MVNIDYETYKKLREVGAVLHGNSAAIGMMLAGKADLNYESMQESMNEAHRKIIDIFMQLPDNKNFYDRYLVESNGNKWKEH